MHFTRTEQLIIDTFGMGEKTALDYLKNNGIKIKRRSWYDKKKSLRERAREVIYQDAKEFEAKHVERITTLRNLHIKALDMLDNESDNSVRIKIMDFLTKLQYDIASFDEASRDLIEQGKTSIQESEGQTIEC